jgi:hypothetical protein
MLARFRRLWAGLIHARPHDRDEPVLCRTKGKPNRQKTEGHLVYWVNGQHSISRKMSDLSIVFSSPVHNNRSVTYGCMPLNIHDKYAQMAPGF